MEKAGFLTARLIYETYAYLRFDLSTCSSFCFYVLKTNSFILEGHAQGHVQDPGQGRVTEEGEDVQGPGIVDHEASPAADLEAEVGQGAGLPSRVCQGRGQGHRTRTRQKLTDDLENACVHLEIYIQSCCLQRLEFEI